MENLSLPEARKLIEKSKDKLQLIVSKGQRDGETARETTVNNAVQPSVNAGSYMMVSCSSKGCFDRMMVVCGLNK